MSDQGERPFGPGAGEDDDWWSQLYDPDAPDTGRSSAGDTLDDRFASVNRTVGQSGSGSGTEGRPAAARDDGGFGAVTRSGARSGPGGPGGRGPYGGPAADEPGHSRGTGNGPQLPEPRTPVAPATSAPPVARQPGAGPGPDREAAEAAEAAVAGERAGERAGEPQAGPKYVPPGPAPAVGRPPRHSGADGAGYRDDVRRAPVPGPRGPAALPPADAAALADLVPDTVLDGAHYGTLTLRAASTRGAAARESGEPRRDALLTARFGGGVSALLLVATASGAGPAPGARRAAREMCQTIGEAVGRSHARLAEDITGGRRGALKSGLKRLTDRCYGRLRAQAAALGLAPAEYTADLRCLLLPADPRSRTRVFFGSGGGGLFRLRDGVWEDIEPCIAGAPAAAGQQPVAGPLPGGAPGAPGTGGAAPGLPGRFDAAEPEAEPEPFRFRATGARPGDTLLLCGTGPAGLLRAGGAFADGLAARWTHPAEVPDLAAFLADVQQDVGGPGGGADRTAVAVWEG